MVTGKLDSEIEKLLIEEYEDPKYGCKYNDKAELLVSEVLLESDIVDTSFVEENDHYIVYDYVVKIKDKFLTYWYVSIKGDYTPSDAGIDFDLSAVRFVKPVEKTVIVYE